MPITFAQPDPVATSISSLYGQGEKSSQDLPLLQRQQEAVSNLYEQQANRRFQAAAQGANASNAAGLQASANSAAAYRQDSANFAHLADSRLQQQERQAEYQGQLVPSQRDAFLVNAQMAQQQQHAELTAWVHSQQMTQAETMRLQRMQNAVGEVMADAGLDANQKLDYVRQLKTGIDGGKMRLEKTHADLQIAQGKHIQSQVSLEATKTEMMAKVMKMTARERIHYEVPDDVRAQIEQEIGPINPAAQAMLPPAMLQAQREALIQGIAKARGQVETYTIQPDGKLEHQKKEPDHQFKQQEHEQKNYESRLNRFDSAMQKATGEARKNLQKGDTTAEPDIGRIEEEAGKIMKLWQIERPIPPTAAKRQPFAGMAPSAQPSATVAPQGIQPAPTAAGQPAPQSPIAVLDDAAAKFNQQNVPPEVRGVVNSAIARGKELLIKNNGYENMSPAEKKEYDHYRELVKAALAVKRPPMPQSGPRDPGFAVPPSLAR